MRLRLVVLTSVVACGGGGSGTPVPDAPAPLASCVIPAGGTAADTSASTNVVGTGTPASCTAAALQTAVTLGGDVRFACGSAAVSIALTVAITVAAEVVIDGGSNVTLDGQNHTRLLEADAALTLQNITLVNGVARGSDADGAGGGAILRRDGALTVIDSQISGSQCAKSGRSIGGGAISLLGTAPALIVGSTLRDNNCANGGAIAALAAGSAQPAPLMIVNSSLGGNTATGSGGGSGNLGNGGNGGGLAVTGGAVDVTLCGTTVTGNHGGAYGGGLFVSDAAGSGTLVIENSELSNNDVPSAVGLPSQGGDAYVQGANIAMTNVTIATGSAAYAAGFDVESTNGTGSLAATNVTFSDMPGTALTAGSGVAGNLTACTFAGNFRALAGVTDFAMQTSALGSNNIGCDAPPHDGGGNVQSPDTTCGGSVPMMDPQLGALGDHGGTTGVRTRAPAAGSPAIGAGKACPAVDARGLPRPAMACTSGAHEGAD